MAVKEKQNYQSTNRVVNGVNMIKYVDYTYLDTPEEKVEILKQPALTDVGWHICGNRTFEKGFQESVKEARTAFVEGGILYGSSLFENQGENPLYTFMNHFPESENIYSSDEECTELHKPSASAPRRSQENIVPKKSLFGVKKGGSNREKK